MLIQRRQPDIDGINKQVASEFACSHSETVRCRKVKSGGQVEIREQCKRCGEQVGAAIRKNTMQQLDIDRLPLWDDKSGSRFAKARNGRHNQLVSEEEQRCYKEWNVQYQQYLSSPEWKGKRQLVLLRSQGICEGCRSAPATDVHHTTYEHQGHELLFELVAVCRNCHAVLHPSAQSQSYKP